MNTRDFDTEKKCKETTVSKLKELDRVNKELRTILMKIGMESRAINPIISEINTKALNSIKG